MAKRKTSGKRKKISKNSALISLVVLLLICGVYMLDKANLIDLGITKPRAVITTSVPENTSNMEVWYLDVGQGGSNLLRIPQESGTYYNMLIDSGEREYGDGLVSYLTALGIEKIDTLVITHPHSDHMGGMNKVIRNFEIGQMYMPETAKEDTPTTKIYEDMLDAISEKNVKLKRLHRGTKIELPDTVSCDVFSPAGDDYGNLNNYSGVLRIKFQNTSFMFPGDAEKLVEKEMLSNEIDLRADVLCLGHHGSDTSTSIAFLEAVSPSVGIISCGTDNKYKHPSSETLENLDKYNIKYYRTDKDGTIIARSDGENISFETGIQSVKSSEE